jgi:hypothetical protein
MKLVGVTFVGPELDDLEVLEACPPDLRRFLEETNGLTAYNGGLHIRGACRAPSWHSLHDVWHGEHALHRLYPAAVTPNDIPFAQDSVGDQWLLRAGAVCRLSAETGDVEDLGHNFETFLAATERDPVETLGLHPLLQFQADGGTLAPGQLLSVYPPFCTEEAAKGVSLAAVPAAERLEFLSELASQLPPDGKFRVKFT